MNIQRIKGRIRKEVSKRMELVTMKPLATEDTARTSTRTHPTGRTGSGIHDIKSRGESGGIISIVIGIHRHERRRRMRTYPDQI